MGYIVWPVIHLSALNVCESASWMVVLREVGTICLFRSFLLSWVASFIAFSSSWNKWDFALRPLSVLVLLYLWREFEGLYIWLHPESHAFFGSTDHWLYCRPTVVTGTTKGGWTASFGTPLILGGFVVFAIYQEYDIGPIGWLGSTMSSFLVKRLLHLSSLVIRVIFNE